MQRPCGSSMPGMCKNNKEGGSKEDETGSKGRSPFL